MTETEHDGPLLDGSVQARSVDALLRRSAQVTDADLAGLDLQAGYDDLLAGICRSADAAVDDGLVPAVWRRRRARHGVALAIAVTVAVGGGAAAAGVISAHTGSYGPPGMTENDTSEYLRLNAPDFLKVARGYAKGVDFAPGYTAEEYLGYFQPSEPMLMQVTGVKGSITSWAMCSWKRTWLEAGQRHDTRSQAVAARHMRGIADLPVMAAINAQSADRRLISAAESGDAQPLRNDVTINCPSPSPATPR